MSCGLATQRDHGVELAVELDQRPLDGRDLRNVAQVTGHAERRGVGELRLREQILQCLERATLVRHHVNVQEVAGQRNDLDGQSTDVHAHVGHGVVCFTRLLDVEGAPQPRPGGAPRNRLSP
jgi:hypothetical protein